MVLNYIWIAFFLLAFIVAFIKLVFLGDIDIFQKIIQATFEMSRTGFEISLGLTGVLTLWMGIMKIGENGGVVKIFSRAVAPFFKKLFPGLPSDSPAYGSIVLNVTANMLGLDNAATPMGLKAMKEMQVHNKDKDTASNAQIMFLVLNTSGLTLIPVSIMVYRAQLGAVNPADIFIPILLATFFSTIAGLLAVAYYQKINLLDKVIVAYLGGLSIIVTAIIISLSSMDKDMIRIVSNVSSNLILFSIITSFIALAAYRKVNVYESFIEGAKEGFGIAVKIIPYLIAILVAVGVFRASGAMDILIGGIRIVLEYLGCNTDFIEALPTALMKPLSGSGARGMMIDAMEVCGADSFVGRLTSIVQGSTDTTFYVLAVYFGSVGIKRTRHALTCGLIADFVGIIAAILMGYLFFS
jgi:spore maturation protein SpmA